MSSVVRSKKLGFGRSQLSIVIWLVAFLGLPWGCSYSIDSGPQDIPIIDRRVDEKQLPQLQGFSFLGLPPSAYVEVAQDGRPWLVSIALPGDSSGSSAGDSRTHLRLVSLDTPGQVWDFPCDQFQLRFTAQGKLLGLILLSQASASFPAGQVTVFPLSGTPRELLLPPGDDHLRLADYTVVSWQGGAAPASLHLTRWQLDDTVQTFSIPWPQAVNPQQLTAVLVRGEQSLLIAYVLGQQQTIVQFVADGSTLDLGPGWLSHWFDKQGYLAYADGQGRLQLYFARSHKALSLDITMESDPYLPAVGAALVHSGFFVCNYGGLIAVDLDLAAEALTGPPRQLDPAACSNAAVDPNWVTTDVVVYRATTAAGDHAYQVPFDGSAAPSLRAAAPAPTVPAGARLLSSCGSEAAYTRSPPSTEPNPITDGWIRGWQFTEHGRAISLSQDCRRVRWFEHAESLNFPFELRSARVEYGPVIRLARSLDIQLELPDGRLLVTAGVYPGISTARLELIDEDFGEALLLLESDLRFVYLAAVLRGDGSAAQWEREVLLETSDPNGRSTLRLLKLPRRQ